jgi:Zn-finger domain-containing protein
MSDTKKGRHRLVIEIDREDHDQLKIVAARYGASVRSTIARFVRDGLINEERELIRRNRGEE